jgi:hypothetical protein
MKTVTEIRMSAIRVINNIVTLKTNLKNGSPTAQQQLEVEIKRLPQIKQWAIENDQLQEIRSYFDHKTWGMTNQFSAREVADYFYEA